MVKKYQIGYRETDGKVKYIPLSSSDMLAYDSLSSDEQRVNFIRDMVKMQ